jgi:hypothetical protein
MVDREYTTVRIPKGYTLSKRENKRLGFVYYVRYRHEGKMLPSKWCCHTNNEAEADKFALENRERIIRDYLNRRRGDGLKVLREFYADGSACFAGEEKRGRSLSKQRRGRYRNVMEKKFIPFLRESGIDTCDQITTATLEDFQDYLLRSGVKPQTANDGLKSVRRVFGFLARKKIVAENPCVGIKNFPVKSGDVKKRGCFELGKPRGVFGDDIEEFLMGHGVARSVAETYNHRDKRGKDMVVKKAKKVFTILDRCLL